MRTNGLQLWNYGWFFSIQLLSVTPPDALFSPVALFGLASLPLYSSVTISRNQCRAAPDASCNRWLGGCGWQWMRKDFAQNEQRENNFDNFVRFAHGRIFHSNGTFSSMPSRTRGRPQQRWDDMLRDFCEHTYGALFGFHSAREHVT